MDTELARAMVSETCDRKTFVAIVFIRSLGQLWINRISGPFGPVLRAIKTSSEKVYFNVNLWTLAKSMKNLYKIFKAKLQKNKIVFGQLQIKSLMNWAKLIAMKIYEHRILVKIYDS